MSIKFFCFDLLSIRSYTYLRLRTSKIVLVCIKQNRCLKDPLRFRRYKLIPLVLDPTLVPSSNSRPLGTLRVIGCRNVRQLRTFELLSPSKGTPLIIFLLV